MKIGIDINDVLRDFIGQLDYTYTRYKIGEDADVESTPVDSFDLLAHFPFAGGIDALNKFMFEEAALEIFGHADQLHDNLINRLNLFNMETVDDGVHELCIVSREAVNSIPATFFFLSKTGCRIQNIRFVTRYEEMWNNVDVLITANPLLLENKPSGKISIKIKAPYNTNVKGDYEFETLFDLMNNHRIMSDINKIEDINYETV